MWPLLCCSRAAAPPTDHRPARPPPHPTAAGTAVPQVWCSHMLAEVYRVKDMEFARYHHAVVALLVRAVLAAPQQMGRCRTGGG